VRYTYQDRGGGPGGEDGKYAARHSERAGQNAAPAPHHSRYTRPPAHALHVVGNLAQPGYRYTPHLKEG